MAEESFEADVSLNFKTETLELARAEAEALLKALKEISAEENKALGSGGAASRLNASTNAMARAGALEQRAAGAPQAAEDRQLNEQIRTAARQKLAGDRLASQMQNDLAQSTYRQQKSANDTVLSDLRKKQRDESDIARQERDARMEAIRRQRNSFSNRLAHGLSSPYTLMSLATGNIAPAAMGLSSALMGTFLSPGAGGGARTSLQTLGAMITGARVAGAAAPAAAAAGETAAAGGGGLLGALGGLLGPIGAAAGILGGGYLYYNSKQADIYRAQAGLRAGTSGAGRSGAQSMYSQILNGGARFFYGQDEAMGTAASLNAAGVSGIGQLSGQTQNAMALSRLDPNISLGDATSLVGELGGAGGMSAEDVAKTFQVLNQQLPQTGISLNRMVSSLKDLEDATGGINTNIFGLAAVQAILGPNISAGQVMAPMLGATGATALQSAAFLGVSNDQFNAMQGSTGSGAAGMFGLAGQRLRAMTGGYTGATQKFMAETILQGSGLFNVNNLSKEQQAQLTNALLTGDTNKAQKLAGSLHDGQAFMKGGDWRGAVANLSGKTVSDVDQAKIAALTAILNAINHGTDELDKLFGKAGGTSSGGIPIGGTGTGSGGYQDAQGNYHRPDGSLMGHWQSMPIGKGGNLHQVWVGNTPYVPPAGLGLGNGYRAGMTVDKINSDGSHESVAITRKMWDSAANAAASTGVPIQDILAVGARESGLNANAPGGGLGQFTPETVAFIRKNAPKKDGLANFDPTNLGQSTEAIGYYLGYLRSKGYKGASVFSHYNAGPNAEVGPNSAAAQYGLAVQQSSSELHITITVKDPNGNTIGGSATKVQHRGKAGARDHGTTPPHVPRLS